MSQTKKVLINEIGVKPTKHDNDAVLALTENYSVNGSLIIRERTVTHLQTIAQQTKATSRKPL